MFNNRNLIFQRTADIAGIFGNAVADVEKFIFLMFKQQINGFGLFVKGTNDVGNIADRVFGNRIEHGRLRFERIENLVKGFGRVLG